MSLVSLPRLVPANSPVYLFLGIHYWHQLEHQQGLWWTIWDSNPSDIRIASATTTPSSPTAQIFNSVIRQNIYKFFICDLDLNQGPQLYSQCAIRCTITNY